MQVRLIDILQKSIYNAGNGNSRQRRWHRYERHDTGAKKKSRDRVAAGRNQAMPRGDATSLPAIQRVSREVSRLIAAVNLSRRGRLSPKK